MSEALKSPVNLTMLTAEFGLKPLARLFLWWKTKFDDFWTYNFSPLLYSDRDFTSKVRLRAILLPCKFGNTKTSNSPWKPSTGLSCTVSRCILAWHRYVIVSRWYIEDKLDCFQSLNKQLDLCPSLRLNHPQCSLEHRTELTKSDQKLLKSLLRCKNDAIFACLNDQIDHTSRSNEQVITDVKECFYKRKIPTMSNFEIGNHPKVQNRRTYSEIACDESTSIDIYWLVLKVTLVSLLMLNH